MPENQQASEPEAGVDASPQDGHAGTEAVRPRARTDGSRRKVPLLRFVGYYLAIGVAGWALAHFVPAAERAFISPIAEAAPGTGPELLGVPTASPQHFDNPFARGVTTALVTVGTVALVLPIAWVYMFTRRYRYDRALVQSVIILPLVVGGMVMIVKNSLALAFSLAGIVAAVRFRNTLKDTRDAVYIFLALAIGLAAGVQALDIGLVMSLSFNLVVLALWRWNLGAIYGTDRRNDMLAMGDPRLHRASTIRQRRTLTAELAGKADSKKLQGAFLMQGADIARLRTAAQSALAGSASEWSFQEPEPAGDGNTLLPVFVKFKKKGTPVEVLGELDENWARDVAAAEYIPFAQEDD